MAVKKRFRMHDSAFIDTSIIRHFLLNTLPQFKKISFPTPNESFVIIAIEVSIFHYISSSFGRPIMWWKMNFLKTKISQNLIYKLIKIYGDKSFLNHLWQMKYLQNIKILLFCRKGWGFQILSLFNGISEIQIFQ